VCGGGAPCWGELAGGTGRTEVCRANIHSIYTCDGHIPSVCGVCRVRPSCRFGSSIVLERTEVV
jgi:hypothetical protein